MKILLISTSYIESTVCENIDMFLNIPITKLYLLKENHISSMFSSSYEIVYINKYSEIPPDCHVYIVYDTDLSHDSINNIISFFSSKENKIHLMIPSTLKEKAQALLSREVYYEFINYEHRKKWVDKDCVKNKLDKPAILVFGMSNFNQQIQFELFLQRFLREKSINCYNVSYYTKFADKMILENILREFNPRIDDWFIDIINDPNYQKKDIISLSLPFDIRDKDIYNSNKIETMINSFNPNYTICCIPRDKEFLDYISDIQVWFNNKYNKSINAFFVSGYETNRVLGDDIIQPMKSYKTVECCNNDCIIVDKKKMDILYEDIIKSITMPNNVRVI